MKRVIVLFLFLSLLTVNAYAASVNLGTASTFGLLGGSGVTNTGSSVINGDVGSSPTPAVTGFPPGIVIGTLYTTPNAVTAQAQSDLTAAYLSAAGAPSPPTNDLTGIDLGTFNAGNPLIAGVYHFSSSAGLTGNLTLDGQGDPNAVWIFQIGSSLTTATNATVSFINGASPCNVFWQVGSSATIQTNNTFGGTIMALTSITLDGGTLNGRALARNGAVTISAAEFVNTECPDVPCVTVAKVADKSIAAVGDLITYTYVVTNCGLTSLTVNSVIDSGLGDLTSAFITANGGTSTLPVGAFTTFTATHTVLATDTSPLVNLVTAKASSGGVDVSGTAQASVIISAPVPSITMVKTANRIVASAGDFVTYTYKVTNSGIVPLTVNSVIDSHLGDLTADFITANGGIATLAPGASTSFIEVYTVLNTDTSPMVNVATVSATGGGTNVTGSDQASVLITAPVPGVTVFKTADRTSASPGDVITYVYTVVNSGAEDLTETSIVDSRLGDLTADFIAANGGLTTLPVGTSVTFTKTYTVTVLDKSPLVNDVTIHATNGQVDVTSTAQASVIITPKAGIHVVKVGNTKTACIGDSICYTVTITNTGNVPLYNLSANDSLVGQLCGLPCKLGVGATATVKYSYKVKKCSANPLINCVTVKACPPCGGEVTDTSCWSVCILQPGVCITNEMNSKIACIGDKVCYTITVTNTGNTPLNNLVVNDTLLGQLCDIPCTLAVGDSVTRTYSFIVTACTKSKLTDTATVKACTQCGSVSASDCWTICVSHPSISIRECVDKKTAKVGDTLTYTITVTNNGDTNLGNFKICDALTGNISGLPCSLAPGGSFSIQFTHVITSQDANPLKDQVHVTADDTDCPCCVVNGDACVSVTITNKKCCC